MRIKCLASRLKSHIKRGIMAPRRSSRDEPIWIGSGTIRTLSRISEADDSFRIGEAAGEVAAVGVPRATRADERRTQNEVSGRGVGTAGATGAKPRGREYLIAPAIFSYIFACCSLNFQSLSLCCLHTIETSHSVGTTGRILRNKLTKHTSPYIFRYEGHCRIIIPRNNIHTHAKQHAF